MVSFGDRLKTLRLQRNFSQSELAQKLGVTKSLISAYELGSRMPSYDILIAIAQIFKVSTDYLLGLESNRTLDLSELNDKEIDTLISLVEIIKNK